MKNAIQLKPVISCWLFALALAGTLGCASAARYEDHGYRRGTVAFRVGDLPAAWRPVNVETGVIAFHHPGGGTISASAECDRDLDVPLDVLTNHLLFGFEARTEDSRTPFVLDGRAALRSHIDGKLDGVPISLDLVVLKKNNCTYDLHLITGRAEYEQRRPDFEAFYSAFATDSPASASRR